MAFLRLLAMRFRAEVLVPNQDCCMKEAGVAAKIVQSGSQKVSIVLHWSFVNASAPP
jgi:hypothetical protein